MKPEYSVAMGGLFLIKMLSDYVDTKASWRYPLDTAVSLNKGDFNTPSVFSFFEKENGGFDCYVKTAVRLALFCLGVPLYSVSNFHLNN